MRQSYWLNFGLFSKSSLILKTSEQRKRWGSNLIHARAEGMRAQDWIKPQPQPRLKYNKVGPSGNPTRTKLNSNESAFFFSPPDGPLKDTTGHMSRWKGQACLNKGTIACICGTSLPDIDNIGWPGLMCGTDRLDMRPATPGEGRARNGAAPPNFESASPEFSSSNLSTQNSEIVNFCSSQNWDSSKYSLHQARFQRLKTCWISLSSKLQFKVQSFLQFVSLKFHQLQLLCKAQRSWQIQEICKGKAIFEICC